jgi:GDPmannose 4,6-dehydratase
VLGIDLPDRNRALVTNMAIRHVHLTDEPELRSLFSSFRPDEIYHLAACHHSSEDVDDVHLSREMVETNFGAAEILCSIVAERLPTCRILLAGSSQMYRAVPGRTIVVDEGSPMNPASFYGRTKAWSRDLLDYYREHFGVFGTTAILFNHESPLRPATFVTRKITLAAARARLGLEPQLHLLDISSATDWSSASDVVEGMRLSLCAREPLDYVLASGVARRVEQVLDVAFQSVGLDWRGFATFGPPPATPRGTLVGNATRARDSLGWKPRTGFERMIGEMVEFDVSRLRSCPDA